MSEAEDKFTEVVRAAMVSTLELHDAEMTDGLFESLAQSIVGSLKLDNWWIHPSRGILEVEEYDWLDWYDDSDQWNVWTRNEGDDDE